MHLSVKLHNMEQTVIWMVTFMNKILIICRSQTEAFAASRFLQEIGIRGRLMRPPQEYRVHSCTYAVQIDAADLNDAKQYLQEKDFLSCTYETP